MGAPAISWQQNIIDIWGWVLLTVGRLQQCGAEQTALAFSLEMLFSYALSVQSIIE